MNFIRKYDSFIVLCMYFLSFLIEATIYSVIKCKAMFIFLQVAKFHEEIEKKQQKQAEKDQKRYDELQAQLAEQAIFDQER